MPELVAAPLPPDQWVRITDGPYRDFIGRLAGADTPERKLLVVLSLFGRPVRVKIDPEQVKKV